MRFTPLTDEQVLEPCLIHEAIRCQDNAPFVSMRLGRPRKPRGWTPPITSADLILRIYHADGRADHVAEKHKVSRDLVYRIWRGAAHADVTGHKQ